MAYEHPHDIVFQQLLQTARLPSASLFRQDTAPKPAHETPHRLQRRRTGSSVATRSSSSYDSEADEGYHADKDNGRRKLLKGVFQASFLFDLSFVANPLHPNLSFVRLLP